MLERHQTYCEKMLDDERFLHFMRSQQADVVVLDHFLQVWLLFQQFLGTHRG